MDYDDQTLSLTGDLPEVHHYENKHLNPRNKGERDSFFDLLDKVNDSIDSSAKKPRRKLKIATGVPDGFKNKYMPEDEYFPKKYSETKNDSKPIFIHVAEYGLKSPETRSPNPYHQNDVLSYPHSARFNSNVKETIIQNQFTPNKKYTRPTHFVADETNRPLKHYLQVFNFGFDGQQAQPTILKKQEKMILPSLVLPDENIQSPKIKPTSPELKINSEPTLDTKNEMYYLRSVKKHKTEIQKNTKSIDLRSTQILHRVKSEEHENAESEISPKSPNLYSGMFRIGQVSDPLASFRGANSSLLLKQIFSPPKDSTSSSEQDIQSPYQDRLQLDEKEKKTLKFKKIDDIIRYRARLG